MDPRAGVWHEGRRAAGTDTDSRRKQHRRGVETISYGRYEIAAEEMDSAARRVERAVDELTVVEPRLTAAAEQLAERGLPEGTYVQVVCPPSAERATVMVGAGELLIGVRLGPDELEGLAQDAARAAEALRKLG